MSVKIKRPTRQQLVNKVSEFLSKNRLMALATTDGKRSWSATVFYAYDSKFNLLFFSKETTRHCKEISKNPNVSVAINHTWRYSDGSIRGLQLAGRASKVSKKDCGRCYAVYKSRFKWADDFTSDHVIYVIKPKEIWYIDEKLLGHFYRERVI